MHDPEEYPIIDANIRDTYKELKLFIVLFFKSISFHIRDTYKELKPLLVLICLNMI